MSWDDITNVSDPPPDEGPAPGKRDVACLIVLAGNGMGEMWKLTGQRTVIGRGASAQVRVVDDGISRAHCEIVANGSSYILRDLGSTNGTFCQGSRIDRHELADGDKILVGSGTVLKFTFHDKIDETFQRQMYESALRDDLTKVFNKKYFMDRIESEFAYAVRHNVPLALVALDIDHFKAINDTYGHPAGDRVLAELMAVMMASVRVEDVLARVGGEEFASICRGADLALGEVVAERLRQVAERRQFVHEGRPIHITISLGVAAVPNPSIASVAEFIAAADRMLYEAKRTGRNRTCIWKP
jgi:diguanylate cyclase (GGDEF)-like protein